MNTPCYQAQALASLLEKQKTATLPELKAALGTDVNVTVFRKLRELSYRTSYSHGGRYYTLDRIPRFDERGLWSHQSAWFSQAGTLVRTLERFIRDAEAGFFAGELKAILHVSVKETLLRLARRGRILRKEMSGRYLYCCPDAGIARRQLIARHAQPMEQTPEEVGVSDEVRAAIVLFMSLLDEKQRRLYAGLESLKSEQGGDAWIAKLLDLHPGTVARGRRELLSGEVLGDRVRKEGAGRKPLEKKRRE